MFSKVFVSTFALIAVMVNAAPIPDNVFTAVKVYHTIINEPPYLVDRTTTIVWTQGPTVTPVTEAPVPTA